MKTKVEYSIRVATPYGVVRKEREIILNKDYGIDYKSFIFNNEEDEKLQKQIENEVLKNLGKGSEIRVNTMYGQYIKRLTYFITTRGNKVGEYKTKKTLKSDIQKFVLGEEQIKKFQQTKKVGTIEIIKTF